ncbi:hypothetical protein DHW03_17075 [Pedobacter yonginense]|uniref:Uncharacterized protein n=2 Tax=Pedobacter yonginense TaxID=651869 RepID=A0A317EI55_9SPHI|nr:hypothetical protein DHW03_17075 [Pedobacter yonginense]
MPLFGKCRQKATKKHTSKAFSLNEKAFFLLITNGSKEGLNTRELSIKVIKILDSATYLEPGYTSAYLNKLTSLIYLKKYQEAIKNIDQAIKSNPSDHSNYLKKGIIYRDYLLDRSKASVAFNKALMIAGEKAKRAKYSALGNDINVAFIIAFAKNKNSALAYLDKILIHYQNIKDVNQISNFKKLLMNNPLDKKAALQMFSNYSTL